MNKTLALIAALGLVASPAFASPEAAKPAAETVKVDCTKAADPVKCEQEAKAAEASKTAPAAGETMKKEEQKN